ncbi:protease inhibitor I42 family protein [Mycobacterium sp. Aquia_216]|uniref:protease inhibitor I42 family protein n=1 Tax=Mycobacterium sp. Aquia_216 TaxID=2991729 RepID=UPI00227C0121|nr:protease inhibitor I42 family protein [Mycobacterium sp. Aquia_216]WAJ45359.1 protease inhibitor I42 family protein [Mycobacterium sp. Aquia_216]
MLSLACLLLAVGCSADPDATAHDSDNGGHVTIDEGDIFDIDLADDYAKSNCQWHDEEKHDFAILKYLGSRYQPNQPPPGAASGGTFTSRYQAVAAGTVHVTLVQEDNANHIARRYSLDVTVR